MLPDARAPQGSISHGSAEQFSQAGLERQPRGAQQSPGGDHRRSAAPPTWALNEAHPGCISKDGGSQCHALGSRSGDATGRL